jgi:hypothetical protein
VREGGGGEAGRQQQVEVLQLGVFVETWRQAVETEMRCGAGSNTEGILQLSVLDLGKTAKLVSDIQAVSQEADLTRIQVVTDEADFLKATRQLVRSQAQVGARPLIIDIYLLACRSLSRG